MSRLRVLGSEPCGQLVAGRSLVAGKPQKPYCIFRPPRLRDGISADRMTRSRLF